ncbi:TPA: type II toxin-antitoxin system RelE/ParE family toxin [Streptococcus suis]
MESIKVYQLIYAPQVVEELKKIKQYIYDISQSEITAKNKIDEIVQNIKILTIFPEAGFNADEKFGKQISPGILTRGMPLKKDYIVLYNIDANNLTVHITYLFSTKSDYLKLL